MRFTADSWTVAVINTFLSFYQEPSTFDSDRPRERPTGGWTIPTIQQRIQPKNRVDLGTSGIKPVTDWGGRSPFAFHWPCAPPLVWEPTPVDHNSLDETIHFQHFHFEALAYVRRWRKGPGGPPFQRIVRHAAGIAVELALQPLFEKFLQIDLVHCGVPHSPFDYSNDDERVVVELKSRACVKSAYDSTVLPSAKVNRASSEWSGRGLASLRGFRLRRLRLLHLVSPRPRQILGPHLPG